MDKLGEKKPDLVEFYDQHFNEERKDFRFVSLKNFLIKDFISGSFLDIGCGTAAMVDELNHRGFQGDGIEPDPSLFKLAEKRKSSSSATYRVFNKGISDLTPEFMSGYSNILLLDILEHVEKDGDNLKKIFSCMKPGSRLLCILPALSALYGKRDESVGHFRRYDKKMVVDLFSLVPFKSIRVQFWNLLGVPVYWWYEKVLQKQIEETFRYKKISWVSRCLNGVLLGWFSCIENKVRFPLGLSLFIKADK